MSFVVILLLFPVDLRGPSHNTDAQNTASLLQFVVTPPNNQAHGVQGVAGSNPAVPILTSCGPVVSSANRAVVLLQGDSYVLATLSAALTVTLCLCHI